MQIQINNEVQLGQGGFGSVFQGTYQNRQVAVKIVPLKDANGKEEEALQQLNHPNIVKLFHVERHNKFKLEKKKNKNLNLLN
jgi:serine/threonine protein kinase